MIIQSNIKIIINQSIKHPKGCSKPLWVGKLAQNSLQTWSKAPDLILTEDPLLIRALHVLGSSGLKGQIDPVIVKIYEN